MNAIVYLIQVNLFLVLFYGFYLLFLKKETFNNLNRIYLVTAAVVAFAVPFLQSDFVKSWFVTQQVSEVIYTTYSLEMLVLVTAEASPYLWIDVLRIIYLSVVIFLSTRLVINILSTNALFSNFSDSIGSAFSFFNRIVVDDSLENHDTIYKHEQVHSKQFHSLDVILFELIAVVCWFNPVVYFYKNAVRNIHEFIADEIASRSLATKAAYATLLVSQQFRVAPSVLTNSFYKPSTLKLRVEMLLRKRSAKQAVLKYGLVAPLFLGMMVFASATVIDQRGLTTIAEAVEVPLSELPKIGDVSILLEKLSDEVKTIDGYVFNENGHELSGASVIVKGTVIGTITDANGYFKLEKAPENATLVFSYVGLEPQIISTTGLSRVTLNLESIKNSRDEVAIYGTPSNKDNSEVFTTVEHNPEFPGGISNMYRYIGENIMYPSAAQKANIFGKVFLKFIVEADGSIGEIQTLKGIGGGCDEEAIRVISQMPKWQPGIQNGKPVRVYYTMPINFRLEPDNYDFNDTKSRITSLKISRNGIETTPDELLIVDGKEVNLNLGEFSAENIDKIDVLKGEQALAKYGSRGKDGVIEITTKKGAKTEIIRQPVAENSNALFIVNGKEMSASEYEKIKKDGVSGYITTTMAYRPEDAIKKYGEKGKNGIVIVNIKE